MTSISRLLVLGILFIILSCGKINNLNRKKFNQANVMDEILTDLFHKSLSTRSNNYFTSDQIERNWIGNAPATERDIEESELRLEIQLPTDYKEFLLIANGYPTYNDAVEPSFENVSQIKYLKDFDPETIEIWSEPGNDEIGKGLSKSIIVGGLQEEQWFLIIPPQSNNEKWRYWKFTNWIPGIIEYNNLKEYFLDITNGIE